MQTKMRTHPSGWIVWMVMGLVSALLAGDHGVRAIEAELVGLAPAAALEGYPGQPPIRDFDPKRDVIENVLG